MKRILTQEEKEKKSSRNKIIIGIILTGIMLLSTIGYAFMSGTESSGAAEKIEYKNIDFILGDNGFWNFEIQGNSFATIYNPEETKNISFNGLASLSNYYNQPLFFNGELADAEQEIARNINGFVLRMQKACIEEKNCPDALPIKNCSSDNVLILERGNVTEIKQENSCVFIYSTEGDEVRAADAFLFKILGL